MLEFDVPRVQSQSFAMQTSVGWAEWLTVTGIRVSTTPLGMALEIRLSAERAAGRGPAGICRGG